MKKLFVMGVCALFVACSSAPEKTESGTAADLKTTAENPTVTGKTIDTSAVATTTVAPVAAQPAGTATPPATTAVAPAKAPAADKPSAKKGEAIIADLDCTVCHKPTIKIIGPAFADIAKKYDATDANINNLAEKVIKGGSGVWGQVPMSPHPGISQSDAKSLVLYVLSFK